MTIEDFYVIGEIADQHDLETVLMRRHRDGVNEFWLSHSNQRYPAIAMSVKGNLSALHYFPRDGHPGFRSAGNAARLNPDGMTTFWISASGDTIDVLNDAVMPFPLALAAAKEFLISDELPQSVEWFKL
jgi:hypothetical protein